jgi:hypothetical protein
MVDGNQIYLNLPKHGEGHKNKGHLKLLET